MAFVFVNVLSYTYYVTTSTLKVGDQRGRIQDVRRETETLPGESMGHRKGQATCSSPIHRISAHNYMSEGARARARVKFYSLAAESRRFLAPFLRTTTLQSTLPHIRILQTLARRVQQNVHRQLCIKRGCSANARRVFFPSFTA